jgi:hypothetical protein
MWHNGWAYLLLDAIALLVQRRGEHADAARLLGYASAWYVAHADQRQPNEAEVARLAQQALDRALGAPRSEALQREGAALNDAQARALATELVGTRRPDARFGNVLDR